MPLYTFPMIRVLVRGRCIELAKDKVKVGRLLEELCINPEDVLVLRNGELVTEDRWVSDGDEVEIYEVVSRG